MTPDAATPRAPAPDALREIDAAWKAEVRAEVSPTRFAHWFRDAAVESVSGRSVVLAVPTDVHKTWVSCAYPALLRKAFGRVLGEGVDVEVRVSARQEALRAVRDHLPPDEATWRAWLERTRREPTLAGFVPEGQNGFLLRLLEQTLHGNPSASPSGIMLFGEAGCGKTHLLKALAAAWNARTPGSALYLTAKRFAERFVAAVRGGDLGAARAFEIDLDAREILLIDDMDDMEPKELTQRALEAWFERPCGAAPRRFVGAGRSHPRELDDLRERLRSRLLSGVLHRAHVPSPELRTRILAERGATAGARPPDDVVRGILAREPSIQGAVTLLDRWVAVSVRRATPAPIGWLGHMTPPPSSSTPVDEIVRRANEVVAGHFGVSAGFLHRATKHPSAVEARRVAFYLAHRAAATPLKSLAAAFGWRSHSTACRALEAVHERRRADPGFEALLDGLLAQL